MSRDLKEQILVILTQDCIGEEFSTEALCGKHTLNEIKNNLSKSRPTNINVI